MFLYLGGGKWEATVVFRARVTPGHKVKQTGHAAACLHWSSPAGKVTWVHDHFGRLGRRQTHIYLWPLHIFKYAQMWGHVSLGDFFFFWQEQEHLFSLMAKWFYITWRLIACDIRGSVIVTLCISDLGRPGGTDAKISSLVISGQRLIHFIGLAQSQGKTWSKATWEGAFRNQKCAFTAINQPSLPLPHHIAGRGSAGWTDRFTTVLSKCQTSSTGPLLWMLWAAT